MQKLFRQRQNINRFSQQCLGGFKALNSIFYLSREIDSVNKKKGIRGARKDSCGVQRPWCLLVVLHMGAGLTGPSSVAHGGEDRSLGLLPLAPP